MSNAADDNFSNIYNLELKLREKLCQLQFKEEALTQSQLLLTESKNFACKLQILLEKERRTVNEVRAELKSAMELIIQLEDEKIHDQIERTQLEINWKNASITQNNLVEQARNTKLNNILLQRKNEILEHKLMEQNILYRVTAESLENLRNQINQLYPTIQSNVENLKQEQKYLCDSFQAVTELYHRIDNNIRINFKSNPHVIKTIEE